MMHTRYRKEYRPQKTMFRLVFYHNIMVKENVFFSERELEKALRGTLTQAAGYGFLFTTAN